MSMSIHKVEQRLKTIVEDFDKQEFIYDLLLAYKVPKSTVTRLKQGKGNVKLNLAKREDRIILKKKLFFQEIESGDLHDVIDDLQKDKLTSAHKPRFLVVTDHKTLLAVDLKTSDTLDIPIEKLPANAEFFLPWMGMEKASASNENMADVRASERMAKLYDELCNVNEEWLKTHLHDLNVFLSRLLFCFFAEDTGIFPDEVFTKSIKSHTQDDGSDFNAYLEKLFEMLDTPEDNTDRDQLPEYLKKFPYVNGKLFTDKHETPQFNARARRMVIECGKLNWKEINPDIFGSMLQAVARIRQGNDEDIDGNDATKHYTSVPNIMKVINPLFLDELNEQYEKSQDSVKGLEKLLIRMSKIRIFDPACGSGNFLIIAYKRLRELEIEIVKRLQELEKHRSLRLFSEIRLDQFFGIEIDDFAVETARLSLWLAEHQMNMAQHKAFGQAQPTIPLKKAGNIVHANATRIEWAEVCPKSQDHETYLLGNPPYKGARKQSIKMKSDIEFCLGHIKGSGNIDYIAPWFIKGAEYIHLQDSKCAFVSTNSICQGVQVSLVWSEVLKLNLEICFAHQSFSWSNNAKGNAGVTVVIIGLGNTSNAKKIIFNGERKANVQKISPYLVAGSDLFVTDQSKPISLLPIMESGSMNNGKSLLLTKSEKDLIQDNRVDRFIKPIIGGDEFLNGKQRYCFWIYDSDLEAAESIPFLKGKIDNIKKERLDSKRKATQKLANTPHKFAEIRHKNSSYVFIPFVSSEKRNYIVAGFFQEDTIPIAPHQTIYDAEPWVFGVVSSRMHMTWVRAVGGRMKTDIRYSSTLCYNTFPFPPLTARQKEEIEDRVFDVLDEREKYPEKTMAQLYDPDKMPEGLLTAHQNLDAAVERVYRSRPFESDEERLEYLFALYEKMTATIKSETK